VRRQVPAGVRYCGHGAGPGRRRSAAGTGKGEAHPSPCRLRMPPPRTGRAWVTRSSSRRRRLDGLRTKPPCHRSDPIYRLCQPGLIEQGLHGSRWTARLAWPPCAASASRRTACGDRFLHRQSTSPSLERHRTQRERLLRPLRTSACWTLKPPYATPLAAGIEIQVPAKAGSGWSLSPRSRPRSNRAIVKWFKMLFAG
jgi:hypothetical protein